jgi:hypothetical protein
MLPFNGLLVIAVKLEIASALFSSLLKVTLAELIYY